MNNFTVLMSVYANDSPLFLEEALESILNQSQLPNQLVIIQDGEISCNITEVIAIFSEKVPFIVDVIALPENHGLGFALSKGVIASLNEIIIRADADDISVNNRFEKLTSYLKENPDISIVGSYIAEFSGSSTNIVGKRNVPLSSKEISKFAKYRSPFNHPSVAFKRSEILKIGNYRSVRGVEDYDLWIRAVYYNLSMANIPESLVLMRVGEGMYSRRGGKGYLKSYILVKYSAYKLNVINFVQFLLGVLIMSIHVNLPIFFKKIIYTKLLHKIKRVR